LTSQPNVVIIVADEMRAGLIENPLVQTPNLSVLAKGYSLPKTILSVLFVGRRASPTSRDCIHTLTDIGRYTNC
jgi:hypothetical protein